MVPLLALVGLCKVTVSVSLKEPLLHLFLFSLPSFFVLVEIKISLLCSPVVFFFEILFSIKRITLVSGLIILDLAVHGFAYYQMNDYILDERSPHQKQRLENLK